MMTLPNRTNYIVERKAEGGEHAYQKGLEVAHSVYSQPNSTGFSFQPPPGHDPKHPHPQEIPKTPIDAHDQDGSLRSASLIGKNGNLTINNPASNNVPLNNAVANTNPNNYDTYRTTHVERLSPEDILEKKNYVQKHRLQAHMLQIVEYCRNEGIIPSLPPTLYTPPQQQTDYSLNEFLESQGIGCPEEDIAVSKEEDEFTFKLVQLKTAYNEELEKLNRVCNDFISKLQTVLQDQAKMRVVTQQELTAKSMVIQQKFDFVRNQLRTNVCSAIMVLQKQYNHQSIKRRRSLSKRATDLLNQWFFDHINDPYPSDEEKSMLAAQCVLSMNQVNNWFGNKRIRYKRKCLEQDARCGKVEMAANAAMEHQNIAGLITHQRSVESPDGLGSPNETGDGSPYTPSPPRKK